MLKAIVFDLGNTLVRQNDGRPFQYAYDVLLHLKNKYKLALVTNVLPTTTLERVTEILREAEIPVELFDVLVVSSEVGVSRPHPRIFQIVLEKMNVKPEEAIMIGNTISTDIFGGNRVGMKTVLIQPNEEYERSEYEIPDHTIHSLKELLELL